MAEHKHTLRDWAERKREKKRHPSPQEQKPHESKLAGAKPMHFDPEDERPTREDRSSGGPPSAPPGVVGL